MCKLLTVLMILMSMMCKAQIGNDSLFYWRPATASIFNKPETKIDTLAVIMLMCDTGTYQYVRHNSVIWERGYEVRKGKRICCGGTWGDEYIWFYETLYYLNLRREKMTNKMIWLSKQLN